MTPPLQPRRVLSLEEKVRILWEEREERERNERQTADVQAHEITQLVEAAVAQVTAPRFALSEVVNARQLGILERSEAERVRRITAEVQLAHIKEREDLDRQVKADARKHRIKVLAIFVPLGVALLGIIGAAITSQIQNSHATVPTEKRP